MTKKITLINPGYKGESWWDVVKLPPYALACVAGIIPEDIDGEEIEIEIRDGNVRDINPDKIDADLVGITAMTATATDAYDIAKEIKSRDIPVFGGGIHFTVLPEEAERYFDYVITGETESVLPKYIADFFGGEARERYEGYLKDIVNMPAPRHDLLDYGKYSLGAIEARRGCPNGCDFCSVSSINGEKVRFRTIEEVIDEVNNIKKNRFMIVDNNIAGTRGSVNYSKSLLRKMANETSKMWCGQATIDISEDDELLKLIADSDGKHLLSGIESIDNSTRTKKDKDMAYIKKAIEKIHDYGITVSGSFIFGTDEQDTSVFKDVIEFVYDADIDSARLEILTPLPGTALYERLDKEGRIMKNNYPEDWRLYNFRHCVFKPKKMTAEELENGTFDATKEITSVSSSVHRAYRSLINTRDFYASGGAFLLNRAIGKSVRGSTVA